MRLTSSNENGPRVRRHRLRTPNTSMDTRSKSTRRLFGRSQSTNAVTSGIRIQASKSFTTTRSKEMREENSSQRRRSFLVRPPTPKGARRVLGVLNTSQKRSSPSSPSVRTPRQKSSPSIIEREKNSSDDGSGQEIDNSPNMIEAEGSSHSSHAQEEQLETAVVPLSPPVGSDANSGREPPLGPPPGANVAELLEVEASEVSDEPISTIDPKSRSSQTSGSTALRSTPVSSKRPPKAGRQATSSQNNQTVGIAFHTVGEEETDIPEAPTSYSKRKESWLGLIEFDERVRELQEEADILRKEKYSNEKENNDLRRKNQELEILISSVRMRASDSNAEIQELNRQMKDGRRRMNRKVRDLEDELAQQKAKYVEEISKLLANERHLRAELDNLIEATLKRGSKEYRSVQVQPSVRDRARAIDSFVALQTQSTHYNRAKTSGSLSMIQRRKSALEPITQSVRSYPGLGRNYSTTSDITEAESSARILARRSLIRRAFIAHIHSSRYGSTRNAWNDFLGGEVGTVSTAQFARAIRSLAVAADARDVDLEKLQCEICDVESCVGVNITFPTFVRFYHRTKDEST